MDAVADPRPLVQVACGVVLNRQGEVLMAQRPAGKIAEGYWEFPGGKIEAGESVQTALARELDEELGIQLATSTPLIDFVQPYTDRRVRLATAWVHDYQGAPTGREGQALAWAHPDRLLDLMPHLPSVEPILAALSWPTAYAITPAVPLGATLPQPMGLPVGSLIRLRQPQWSDAAYADVADAWVAQQRVAGYQPVLDRDPRQAATLETLFHASEACWRHHPRSAQWPRRCLASVHDAEGAAAAARWGADALVLGQVESTPSHPQAAALGWRAWSLIARAVGLRTYAIGGQSLHGLAAAQAQGAHGIAAIREWGWR
jgi:8-oxo-dGTP diphosphatase